MEEMANSIVRESELRRDYFEADQEINADGGHVPVEPFSPQVETIYFGGGTPSLLPEKALGRIMDTLYANFQVSVSPEITLEANPDDLTLQKLHALKAIGVNRLSIGIQSFSDADLLLLNRSHNAQQADRSVKAAQDLGFENITIDLIYGIPGSGIPQWQSNVAEALALQVPHISAYSLTVEEKTLLHHQVAKGIVSLEPDAAHEAQYFHLIDHLAAAGIHQYELSNFAKPGYRSRHNGAYWKGVPYLGLGPSAHSYIGNTRSWNIANNATYIRALQEGKLAISNQELLSERDRLNEYLLTQLRIVEGVDLKLLRDRWGYVLLHEAEEFLDEWKANEWIVLEQDRLRLTRNGFMVSDAIIRELFSIDD
jgi:oxygen-independent coproporphyrinogen-3 oxidase